jgi:hypothetical protein
MKIGVISYLLRHHKLPAAMEFLQDIGFTRVELGERITLGIERGRRDTHYVPEADNHL